MARSASVQFGWFTRAQAIRATAEMKESSEYGDRMVFVRRLTRVVSRAEVEANERYLASLGYLGPWRIYGR